MKSLAEDKEKLRKEIQEAFPDKIIKPEDLEECRQSLVYLGKAIYLYSLQLRRENAN